MPTCITGGYNNKMEKQIIIFILFFCGKIFSQDTIFFKNGEIKQVKVDEITASEIKFYRFESPQGPLYTADKYKVQSIKYANGQIDKFNVSDNPNIDTHETTVSIIAVNDRLEYFNRSIFYRHRGINNDELSILIEEYPKAQKRQALKTQFDLMKKYKRNQLLFGFGAPVAGLGIYLAALALSRSLFPNQSSNATIVSTVGLLVGVSAYVVGNILKQSFKTKRYRATAELVNMYNE